MGFKFHPYYDQSDNEDWLALDLALDSKESIDVVNDSCPLIDHQVRRRKHSLCNLALERIRLHAGTEYLIERRYPTLNEFLFIPMGDLGFRVYIEYFFHQNPNESSPDSDYWWVIISCPCFDSCRSLTKSEQLLIIGLGWRVA